MWASIARRDGTEAKDYSTGMKERLELCLSLVPHPRFLFLDEPQNGLDPDGIASLSETLFAKFRHLRFAE